MFSPQFMRYLLNYNKEDNNEVKEVKKAVRFKPPRRGKLMPVVVLNR